MERPILVRFFENKGLKEVHESYLKAPELYAYAQSMDNYADWLEQKKKRILFSLFSEYPEYAKELLTKQTGTNTLVSTSGQDACDWCEGKGWYINEEHKKYPDKQQKLDCYHCGGTGRKP